MSVHFTFNEEWRQSAYGKEVSRHRGEDNAKGNQQQENDKEDEGKAHVDVS